MPVPWSMRLISSVREVLTRTDLTTDAAARASARGPYVPEHLPVLGPILAAGNERVTGRPHPDVAIGPITVPGAVGDLAALRYQPPETSPSAPLVLHFHGGGFTVGAPVQYRWFCSQLAARLGAVVVSVDYRKAPEHPAPAAADDARAVAAWLLAGGGGRLVGAPGPCAVVGDSAGGNLSALVAIAARDHGWPRLVAQLLVYPGIDLTRSFPSIAALPNEPFLPRRVIEQFMDCYLSGDVAGDDPTVSPWFVDDLTGVAPAVVATGEFDPLKDEGNAYAERLGDAGVEVDHHQYADMPHGFASLPGLHRAPHRLVDRLVTFAAPRLRSPRTSAGGTRAS